MRSDLVPTTLEGTLDHLGEECSEVIKAIFKIRRFGPTATDPKTGKTYDNVLDLKNEIRDLEQCLSRLKTFNVEELYKNNDPSEVKGDGYENCVKCGSLIIHGINGSKSCSSRKCSNWYFYD